MKVYSIIIEHDDSTEDELHTDIIACDPSYMKTVRAARYISKGLSMCREVSLNKVYVIATDISDEDILDEEEDDEEDN